jgi:hypothetical protein
MRTLIRDVRVFDGERTTQRADVPPVRRDARHAPGGHPSQLLDALDGAARAAFGGDDPFDTIGDPGEAMAFVEAASRRASTT